GVDQRRLDVVDRRGVEAAARVQAVGGAEAGRVRPGQVLACLAEREARAGLLVQERRQERARGERLARLVWMVGVPPDAAFAPVPADGGDVAERPLGVREVSPRAG